MKWIIAYIAAAFGYEVRQVPWLRRAGSSFYRPAIGKLPTRKFV